jgi:dUTPase
MKIPTYKFAVLESLKNHNPSFIPTKAHETDTGWDVRAHIESPYHSLIIHKNEYVRINLGFRCFCPPGWWLELRPRSSTFAKKFMHCLYGVIDNGYENVCMLAAQYVPDISAPHTIEISNGDAIGQIIPVKLQNMKVEEISNQEYDLLCQSRNSKRGTGGFGSSTKV